MKKYNIQNYIRYKEDVKSSMPDEDIGYSELSRDKLIIRFLPLVENLARKFSTTQQASGVLSINDLLQEGGAGLTKAVDNIFIRHRRLDIFFIPDIILYIIFFHYSL